MGEVAAEMYTQDGTVDIKGNPALKKDTGNWRACPYILANECCERLAYYGMSTNLVNFMKDRMGMANAAAANNVTNWGGTCYITPLIGAFLADAYLGRFWTIASFMIIYIFGLGLLTMATSVHGLVPTCAAKGVCDPTPGQSAAVFIALYLIALGTGGIKPCVSSFGADQFDEHDDVERKSKSSFFNWFYFSINIGALVASSVLVYVQTHVGWSWGFCLPAGAIGEELKSVGRRLPIWASGIVFATVYGQMSTMFVLQGNTLDASIGPKFKIPSASLSIFDTLSVIAWVPVYDRLLVPAVRSVTGRPRGFTQLQRMGIGLVVSMFAMLAAGVLELVRLRTIAQRGLYGEKDVVPISIFWQVPQYFIIGAAEVFTFVGQLEFFYDQAPDAMRSMCSALSLTTVALGNYLSTLLVTVVAKLTTRGGKQGWIPDNLNVGHLDYFFWLLAALSLLNFAVYLLIASWYTYKKTAEDDTDAKAKGGADD
ncbi:Peptide transporter PTR5 [Triticum urartu]|uniref:Peptide transporter PTR5 n=1 Tax=Triticum urartu TaxID=4572 RepID=M8A367_TRIUA|nr:Peptide transporter PTR5 [Triticum urartu]